MKTTNILFGLFLGFACTIVHGLGDQLNDTIDESSIEFIKWKKARSKEFPWVARILTGESQICAGTLVGDKWVLTSATCVFDRLPSDLSVILGDYKIGVTTDVQTVGVEQIIINENFVKGTSEANVAMLKLLDNADTSNARIEPIDDVATDTYFKTSVYGKLQCYITGWGKYRKKGSLVDSSTIGKKKVTIVNKKECENKGLTIARDQFCTEGGEADICMVQGGTAIACTQRKNKSVWTLVGINIAHTCESNINSAVKTSFYRSWIRKVMNNAEVCAAGQFQCYPGNQCVAKSQICDDTVDCLDNFADEPQDACGTQICSEAWRSILINKGSEMQDGSRSALVTAIQNGARVKALWGNILVDCKEVSVYDDVQMHVVGKQTSTDLRKHNLITLNTEGDVTITTADLFQSETSVQTWSGQRILWFIRPLVQLSNAVTKGVAKKGASIFVVSTKPDGVDFAESLFSLTPSSIETADSKSGSELWIQKPESVRKTDTPDVLSLGFMLVSSTGVLTTVTWEPPASLPVSTSVDDSSALTWFIDPCWELAYKHDFKGNAIRGSIENLLTAIRLGKGVRVLTNNFSFKPILLRIRNRQVTAQGSRMQRQTLEITNPQLRPKYAEISTTGKQQYVDFQNFIGFPQEDGKDDVEWYVESRPWSRTVRYSLESQTYTEGSKSLLGQAIDAAKDARMSVDIDDYEVFFDVARLTSDLEENEFGVTVETSGDSDFTWKTPYTWANLLVFQYGNIMRVRQDDISLDGTTFSSTGLTSTYIDVFNET